jgi:hypothetical protein
MKTKKSKNNKCLKVGKCSFYYIYILITGLLFILKNTLLSLKDLSINQNFNLFGIETIISQHGFIKLVIENLGYILFGYIFSLIFKNTKIKRNYEKNEIDSIEAEIDQLENNVQNNNNIKLLYKENNIKKTFSINLLIACGIFATQLAIRNILTILNTWLFDLWVFDLIFISIFMKKIFNYKIYKHHLYIFVFNIIINFILFIVSSFIKNSKGDNLFDRVKNNFGNYGYCVLFYIAYLSISCMLSFSKVLQKKVMDFEYISPFKIVIMFGIISTLFSFVALIIASFINCSELLMKSKLCPISNPEQKNEIAFFDNIFIFFGNLKDKYHVSKKEFFLEILLVYPLYSFIGFMKYLCETMIVYHLNPYYVLISDNIYYSTKKIFRVIFSPNDTKIYLRLIGEIIASIANLFFLEILEFNCCGLNYDTKINIQKRGKLDCSCDILDDNKYIFDFGTINSDYQSDADNQSNNPDELLKENEVYT